MPEIKEPTSEENRFMQELMILRNNLVKRKPKIYDRLGSVKYGKRDLGLLIAVVDRLQDGLYATLPTKTLQRYLWISKNARCYIDVPGPISNGGYMGVALDDLDVLAKHAIMNECSMCMKEGKEIKQCPLRQALNRIQPREKIGDGSLMGCEYTETARDMTEEDDDGN